MSAPVLTRAKIDDLAAKAQQRIDEESSSRSWADLWPIAKPFIDRGGRTAVVDAVQFLIDENIISESERVAAEAAFRRVRKYQS